MSIYRIIRIASGSGYKVHVTSATNALRVIGIFLTAAAATEWIAIDRESRLSERPAVQEFAAEVGVDRG